MSSGELVNAVLMGLLIIITGYYAVQTHRQAKQLKDQVQLMVDQRKQSITPALHVVDRISYHRAIKEMNSNHMRFWYPYLDLPIKNIGSGPAFDIKMSANVSVLSASLGEKDMLAKSRPCHLFWELCELSKDICLESNKVEPEKYRLRLIKCESISRESVNGEMLVNINYKDIDGNTYNKETHIQLSIAETLMTFDTSATKIIPGADNFPEDPQLYP